MKYSVLVNGERFEVALRQLTRSSACFEVNSRTFEVALEESVPLHQPSTTSTAPAPKSRQRAGSSGGTPNHVCSPIPGVILEILATEGATVAAGDIVARIEAMKMENNIFAHRSGKITKIFVSAGSEVGDGEPLLQIDT